MRLVYLPCILLAAVICTCAGNVVPLKEGIEPTNHQAPDVTTAVPLKPANTVNTAVVTDNSKTQIHSTPVTVSNVNDTNNDTSVITTAIPTLSSLSTNVTTPTTPVTKPITTKPITTKKPEPTTEKPVTQNSTTSNAPPSTSVITASPTSVTTAVPISTKEAPPSQSPDKERHFDGLSFIDRSRLEQHSKEKLQLHHIFFLFIGGIILAVCLMAIGTFSCKFYRTLKEGNYRTL